MCNRILVALLFALAFAPATRAQIDVAVPATGSPFFVLGRSLTVNTAGLGGTNNNFVIQPATPDTGICLYFNNTSVGSSNITITAAQTGDASVQTYTGNTGKWIGITSFPSSPTGSFSFAVAAGAVGNAFLRTSGAARVAAIISTSGSGTMDIYGLQGIQGCGGPFASGPNPVVTGNLIGPGALLQCDNVTTGTVSSGTTGTLLSGVAGKQYYVCLMSVTQLTATALAAYENLGTGSSGTCGSVTAGWQFILPGSTTAGQTGAPYIVGGNTGFFYRTSVLQIGQPLCYVHAATGAAAYVTISYAVF